MLSAPNECVDLMGITKWKVATRGQAGDVLGARRSCSRHLLIQIARSALYTISVPKQRQAAQRENREPKTWPLQERTDDINFVVAGPILGRPLGMYIG